MTINEQWVRDVARDDARLIHIQFIDIFNQVDALSLARIRRLNNPHVTLWLGLLQLVVVGLELVEFIRQHVSVWQEIKGVASEFLPHFQNVVAQSILSGDLMTLREVIDALVLV